MEMICSFRMEATLVANEFVDRYMAAANGEYVKVYLYLLRHQQETVDISRIADALDHTESDVRRALAYWEKLGVLRTEKENKTVVIRGEGEEGQEADARTPLEEAQPAMRMASGRPHYSQDQVNGLADDGDFTQLLYIAQKYCKQL